MSDPAPSAPSTGESTPSSTPPPPPATPDRNASLPVTTDPANIEIRVGKILTAKPTPKALIPAYALSIDFGEEIGVKNTSTQITKKYTVEELPGLKILCIVNRPRLRIGKFYSEVVVLGLDSEEDEGTVLVLADPRAKIGTRAF